jgi:hypothetical protein
MYIFAHYGDWRAHFTPWLSAGLIPWGSGANAMGGGGVAMHSYGTQGLAEWGSNKRANNYGLMLSLFVSYLR